MRDFFGRIQNQEIYGRKVIAGNKASLKILPFPENGRPDDFFGLSGNIALNLSIAPVEVHIGDPVTLTLQISGMNNPEVRIPSLKNYLGPEIDVPETRSSGQISGTVKTVTQTIRINNPEVKQIPAISFCYFDTDSGGYKYASSEPVPVTVLDTKILTAADLEGGKGESDAPHKILLEETRGGIYHNYTGMKLLKPRRKISEIIGTSILIKLLFAIPPSIYAAVLIFTIILPQIRKEALKRMDRKKALRRLKKFVRNTAVADSGVFLKEFNMKLNDFLKKYGTQADSELIRPDMDTVNRSVYGALKITFEEAFAAAKRVVEGLEDSEVPHV